MTGLRFTLLTAVIFLLVIASSIVVNKKRGNKIPSWTGFDGATTTTSLVLENVETNPNGSVNNTINTAAQQKVVVAEPIKIQAGKLIWISFDGRLVHVQTDKGMYLTDQGMSGNYGSDVYVWIQPDGNKFLWIDGSKYYHPLIE